MKASRWQPVSEEERFWMKVDIRGEDECWPFGSGEGYQRFRAEYGPTWAHKRALEFKLKRRLKPGMTTLHSCDSRPCCNPKHLSEGTRGDNTKEMWDKGRARPNGIPRRRGEGTRSRYAKRL